MASAAERVGKVKGNASGDRQQMRGRDGGVLSTGAAQEGEDAVLAVGVMPINVLMKRRDGVQKHA